MKDEKELQDFPWVKEKIWLDFEEELRRWVDGAIVDDVITNLRTAFDACWFEVRPSPKSATPITTPEAAIKAAIDTILSLRTSMTENLTKVFLHLANREIHIYKLERQLREMKRPAPGGETGL